MRAAARAARWGRCSRLRVPSALRSREWPGENARPPRVPRAAETPATSAAAAMSSRDSHCSSDANVASSSASCTNVKPLTQSAYHLPSARRWSWCTPRWTATPHSPSPETSTDVVLPCASMAVTVTLAEPMASSAGVTVIVRLAPVPPSASPYGGQDRRIGARHRQHHRAHASIVTDRERQRRRRRVLVDRLRHGTR